LSGVAGLQEALAKRLPYLEAQQVQRIGIAFGASRVEQSNAESDVMWKFTGDDPWTLVVDSGAAALFVNGEGYQGIEDFSERYSEVLAALYATGRIRRCDRLGVRYINIAPTLLEDGRAWSRWFKSEFVGWVGGDIVQQGTRLLTSLAQVQLTAPPIGTYAGFPVGPEAWIRHGLLPPGTQIPLESGIPRQLQQMSYVIDLDLFVQAPQPFDPHKLLGQFGALHDQIDAFFRWSLTPEGEQHFGLEARE